MSRYYVVDAGVLFSTWAMGIRDAQLVTTSNILSEIRNKPSQKRAEILILLERMTNVDPSDEYVNRARATADYSGDFSAISTNDIELIALALMLVESGEKNVILVSTDMAVLNTASHLGLDILDPSGKFERKITWVMICPACHYKSMTVKRETECPVCGTEMRRKPMKTRKLR
jgi:rRNA maturation endonuclease Nob1